MGPSTHRDRNDAKTGLKAINNDRFSSSMKSFVKLLGPKKEKHGEDKENNLVTNSVPTIGWSELFKENQVKEIMTLAKLLNAPIVEDPSDYSRITHFIASYGSKPMPRSFRAMLAYQYTANMVTMNWLRDSYESNRFPSCEKYLTIKNKNIERKPGGVLVGYAMHVCDDSIGNMPKEKIGLLIEASGATSVNLLSLEVYNAKKLIVLISPLPETNLPIEVHNAFNLGAHQMRLMDFFHTLLPEHIVIVNQFKMDSSPDISPVSGIPPQTIETNKTETSLPLRDPVRQYTTEQTTTVRTQRKSAVQQKLNTLPKKASKTPSLAKIYEVEQDGAMFQDATSREKAVAIGQKYGFDLNFSGQTQGVVDATAKSSIAPDQSPRTKKKTFDKMKLLFSTQLARSPSRTLSNQNIGDPAREFLGADGLLEVFRSSKTKQIVVRYNDSTGETKFEARVPKKDPYKSIFGNSGEQNVFAFDAFNKFFSSGGTTVEGAEVVLRRYFFWFASIPQLSVALFFVFNEDMLLVEDFFNKNGDFYARGETRPPHVIVKGEDDMDIDDYTPIRHAALDTDVAAGYANFSVAESQPDG